MSLSFVSKTIQTTRDDGGYDEKPVTEQNVITGGLSSSYATTSTATYHGPLYEQLRNNKEQDEAEREEFQRSIMRGTLALDDDDVAHLDTLRQQKHDEDEIRQKQTQIEIDAFHEAQQQQQQQKLLRRKTSSLLLSKEEEEDDDDNDRTSLVGRTAVDITTSIQRTNKRDYSAASSTSSRGVGVMAMTPKIFVKKKKRLPSNSANNKSTAPSDDAGDKGRDHKGGGGGGCSDNLSTPTTKSALASAASTTTATNPNTTDSGGGGLSSLLTGYSSSSEDDQDD